MIVIIVVIFLVTIVILIVSSIMIEIHTELHQIDALNVPAVMRSWYTWGVFCPNSAINKSCCTVWYQQTWLMLNGWGMARTRQVEVGSCVSLNSQVFFGVSSRDLSKRRIPWDQLKLWAGDMNNYVGLCFGVPTTPPTKKTPTWKCGVSTTPNNSQLCHCVSIRLWREIWLWPPSHDQKHPRRCF